jgi:hypothetical protein
LFRKKLLDERGVGLILVLVVCSLVGAAAVYLMNLSKETDKKLTNDARVLSYNSLVQMVANKLQTGNGCIEALNGLNVSGAFNRDGQSVSLDLKLDINKKPLQKPTDPNQRDVWFLQGGTIVKDVRLFIHEKIRAPVRLAYAGSPVLTGAKGYIQIIPGHPGVGINLIRNRNLRIPIFVYYSGGAGSATLTYCGPPNGEAFFCTSVGGAYDHAAATEDTRCQPDRTCFAYKTGMVTSPSACPSPYQSAPIGWMGSQLYLCEWCNPNPLQAMEATGYYYDGYHTKHPADPTPDPEPVVTNPVPI